MVAGAEDNGIAQISKMVVLDDDAAGQDDEAGRKDACCHRLTRTT